MSAPPASPRRQWTPPSYGAYFLRATDQSVWQVRNIDRASRQVQLVADIGNEIHWVPAGDLEREYREVVS